LELLWHFAARFALGGNVGKFSDAEIEAWLGWDGETGALIAGLVAWRSPESTNRKQSLVRCLPARPTSAFAVNADEQQELYLRATSAGTE
jgi:hypothetical protein